MPHLKHFHSITWVLGLVACTSALAVAPNPIHPGAAVFQAACASCHALGDKSTGIAPPAFGMKNHVMKAYPEREAFIAHIVQWTQAPNAAKTLMPGAVLPTAAPPPNFCTKPRFKNRIGTNPITKKSMGKNHKQS